MVSRLGAALVAYGNRKAPAAAETGTTARSDDPVRPDAAPYTARGRYSRRKKSAEEKGKLQSLIQLQADTGQPGNVPRKAINYNHFPCGRPEDARSNY